MFQRKYPKLSLIEQTEQHGLQEKPLFFFGFSFFF